MKLQKVTERREHGRWYGDSCGAAFALELVGERWSLLLIRELVLGARRFSDLRKVLPGISARVLTERLEQLEAAGIVERQQLGPPANAQVYALTPWGQGLRGVLVSLCNWGVRSHDHNPGLGLSPSAWVLSMQAMFDSKAARGVQARIGFAAAGESMVVTLDDGHYDVARGDAQEADIAFTADTTRPFLRAFYGKVPLEVLEREDGLRISGNRALADTAIPLFRVPRGELG